MCDRQLSHEPYFWAQVFFQLLQRGQHATHQRADAGQN